MTDIQGTGCANGQMTSWCFLNAIAQYLSINAQREEARKTQYIYQSIQINTWPGIEYALCMLVIILLITWAWKAVNSYSVAKMSKKEKKM